MPLCVGIGGGSGSGKSWLAGFLKGKLGKRAVIVCQDWYYRDNGHVSGEAAKKLNFDHPRAIERALFSSQLSMLLAGRAIERPCYDYARHARLKQTVRVDPADVVIVEGLLVLHDRRLRELMDLSVFIDVPSDVRLVRRIRRDVEQRRVDLEETLRLYEHCVKPMHDRFIQPSAQHALYLWKQEEDRSFPQELARVVEARLGSSGSTPRASAVSSASR